MMKIVRSFVLSLTVLVGVGGMALPSLAHAAPPPTVIVPAEAPRAPRALSADEAQSLGQREKKSKDLAKYEGGQVVIVISTLGVIVIALIIILILI